MQLNQQALQQLRNDVGDDVLPMIIEQFRKELQQRADALRDAIAAGDIEAIGLHAHSVKSTARTCGLDELSDCAAEAETAARASRSEEASAHANQLVERVPAGIACLDKATAAS